MQLLAMGAGQQRSYRGCALQVQALSWMLTPGRQFSSWGWVLAIYFCLLRPSKHSLAQFHKSCTLPSRTPSLAQISRVATTALGLTESMSRPGCRKKTLSKEMNHIQKDFSCSCSHDFYCIFLQSLCLLTHTTGSTQSLCPLPVYRRISKPLTALPEGSPLSKTQSSRKQMKKQYQSQVGLCASSPWDTTELHSSWNCHDSGKCSTAYSGPSEMPRN